MGRLFFYNMTDYYYNKDKNVFEGSFDDGMGCHYHTEMTIDEFKIVWYAKIKPRLQEYATKEKSDRYINQIKEVEDILTNIKGQMTIFDIN